MDSCPSYEAIRQFIIIPNSLQESTYRHIIFVSEVRFPVVALDGERDRDRIALSGKSTKAGATLSRCWRGQLHEMTAGWRCLSQCDVCSDPPAQHVRQDTALVYISFPHTDGECTVCKRATCALSLLFVPTGEASREEEDSA